jgi:DNA phosphorothioation-associated putative methyltransferase
MSGNDATTSIGIERHRAAIVRNDLSKPVRLALGSYLLDRRSSFFDYGCGHGRDVALLRGQGYRAAGWDPYYFPDEPKIAADIVNLGYVLNVIEADAERKSALASAWSLCTKAMIVSAQVSIGAPGKHQVAYNDGFVTSRNTFQKYYEPQELKGFIDRTIGVDAIPVGLGIYVAFRDDVAAESFRAARFRGRLAPSSASLNFGNFEDNLSLLQPLIDFVNERGREPTADEIAADLDPIIDRFRTISRAFAYVKKATGAERWEEIYERRKTDMLVYLALARFERRPNITALPKEIQLDIKAFFGNYKNACSLADDLLFSLGDPTKIAFACSSSAIGKFVGNALYVHASAINELDPVLRVFEGCASRAFGQLDEVTLIKFRTDKPKVSYLYYPDFDSDPHPALHSSMQANLRSLNVDYRDYTKSENPPVLHRKETFVPVDYPNYKKFAKLTSAEEKAGLLDASSSIGNRFGWQQRLSEKGVQLRGHQLRIGKVSDASPE